MFSFTVVTMTLKVTFIIILVSFVILNPVLTSNCSCFISYCGLKRQGPLDPISFLHCVWVRRSYKYIVNKILRHFLHIFDGKSNVNCSKKALCFCTFLETAAKFTTSNQFFIILHATINNINIFNLDFGESKTLELFYTNVKEMEISDLWETPGTTLFFCAQNVQNINPFFRDVMERKRTVRTWSQKTEEIL